MCLNLDETKTTEMKTSGRKNIVVWKIFESMDGFLQSPLRQRHKFNNFGEYESNRKANSLLPTSITAFERYSCYGEISYGLHVFTREKDAISICNSLKRNSESVCRGNNLVVVKINAKLVNLVAVGTCSLMSSRCDSMVFNKISIPRSEWRRVVGKEKRNKK